MLEIAPETKIPYTTVQHISTETLGLKTLSTTWVRRLLTAEKKAKRVECFRQLLDIYDDEPEEFFQRLVTGDIHHYDQKSKQESMLWLEQGERPLIKAKPDKSKMALMANFFGDFEMVLRLGYLPRNTTLTFEYYCKLLEQLR